MIYDLETSESDTLSTEFDLSLSRTGLWLRYSPDDSQILYANYPAHSLSPVTNDDSEMGIIDLKTQNKRVLNVNTNNEGQHRSVQIAPEWSYDGKHIIYASATVNFPDGTKGFYSLYMLKNVDAPENYIERPQVSSEN